MGIKNIFVYTFFSKMKKKCSSFNTFFIFPPGTQEGVTF